MARNLFSVPIFFIVFRETLEAAIIVSVLLGLVEQLVYKEGNESPIQTSVANESSDADSKNGSAPPQQPQQQQQQQQPASATALMEDDTIQRKRLLRKMRIQIFVGAAIGLLIALSLGAAFIAVWFTKANDLWSKSEELWEGIFNLIASLMIFAMGISVLKMDRAKVKWKVKLAKAFEGGNVDREIKAGKWVLLILPLVTVMREGLEAVVFVGGVSLGQPATAIPIATIVGIICGLVCGFIIYEFASRTVLTVFLIVMTNLLLLIGAGLFSKAVGNFEGHAFSVLLGADVDDSGGTGPGSYDVRGNVWHLECCSSGDGTQTGLGWTIFGAIFGWSNNGSLGTILSYVFYWIAVIAALIYLKFSEGRTSLVGMQSAVAKRREERRALKPSDSHDNEEEKEYETDGINALPR